uniref:Uncharacterized protein n=1 Tax=viral metagenome TaxID=1070528 RepID=A0A6M3LUP7_9ZZZZ
MNKKNFIKESATPEQVMEKLFCVAIINQGTEIASKIFKSYLDMRKIIEE